MGKASSYPGNKTKKSLPKTPALFYSKALNVTRMNDYRVGEKFPHTGTYSGKGIEVYQANINDAFFDVLYYIPDPPADEVAIWKRGDLCYGIYIAESIPFFIISLQDSFWSFTVGLNIHKIKSEEQQSRWLNSNERIISLFIIHSTTNILVAKRMIEIESYVADMIKNCMVDQSEIYADATSVDKKIVEIMGLQQLKK